MSVNTMHPLPFKSEQRPLLQCTLFPNLRYSSSDFSVSGFIAESLGTRQFVGPSLVPRLQLEVSWACTACMFVGYAAQITVATRKRQLYGRVGIRWREMATVVLEVEPDRGAAEAILRYPEAFCGELVDEPHGGTVSLQKTAVKRVKTRKLNKGELLQREYHSQVAW